MQANMPKRGVVLVFVVIAASVGGLVPSAFAQKAFVAVTGQTTSYADGDDGDIQAGVRFPAMRFVDKRNGTVRDRLTGLTWLQDANCFGERSWQNSLNAANNLGDGQCGLTDGSAAGDWRLPNVREQHSLIDYGHVNPALPPGHPFVSVQTRPYWTSTTSAGFPEYAWTIPMDRGGSNFDDIKDNTYYAWPVRLDRDGRGFDDASDDSYDKWPVRGGHERR